MRILGLDIGSSSIKALEMDSAFGRFDIHDYHEHTFSSQVSSPEEATALLISKLAKAPEKIVICLKNNQSTFRNLTVPTRDKKSIQAGVAFELEDELPFPLEELVYDFSILSQGKQGSALYVAASLRHHVSDALNTWHQSNVYPDIITTEPWAYRTLLNRVLGTTNPESPVLLIQAGHEKTTLYLHWRQAPAIIHELPWGGNDITLSLSEKFNIDFEEAEATKLDRGFIETSANLGDLTLEQQEFSQHFEGQFSILLREIKKIELMCRSVTQHSIGLVLLSGGTSLLPGLGSWLEEKLNVPTKPLLALSAVTISGVTYSEQTDSKFGLAAALTLAFVGPDRTNCINFRKGEFSKSNRARQLNFKLLKKPLIAASIVSFTLFLSLIVQSSVYQSKLKSSDVLLERSIKSFLGDVQSGALKTFKTSPSTLKNRIEKELNKNRELSKLYSANPHSPIDFLNRLSLSIPKELSVDLLEYNVGTAPNEPYTGGDQSTSATLSFLVQNVQTADKLMGLLETKLTSLQKEKIEESSIVTKDGSKRWKIVFKGKPTEDAYAR